MKNNCCDKINNNHPDHTVQLNRVKRIAGQVVGIQKMIEEGRYCPDIINQISAAQTALRSLQAVILQEHLKQCVVDTFKAGNQKERQIKIDELVALIKKF